MDKPAKEFSSLNNAQQRFVHFELCKNALVIWDDYIEAIGEISYIETVVGTKQFVDKLLLNDAFQAAANGIDLHKVEYRFREPITAIQDSDLEFPDNIEFAFYAIYNLFNKYVLNKNINNWLIYNQALSAETDSEKWQNLLNNAALKSL